MASFGSSQDVGRAVRAVPALLDAIDSADQRIAELEARLLVATETNIADRKRMRELEAGLREACEAVEGNYEDQRTRSEPLECPHTGEWRKLAGEP